MPGPCSSCGQAEHPTLRDRRGPQGGKGAEVQGLHGHAKAEGVITQVGWKEECYKRRGPRPDGGRPPAWPTQRRRGLNRKSSQRRSGGLGEKLLGASALTPLSLQFRALRGPLPASCARWDGHSHQTGRQVTAGAPSGMKTLCALF